ELFSHELLQRRPVRTEGSECSDGASHAGNERWGKAALQSIAVAVELIEPTCELEPKGHGKRVLTVRASRLNRTLMLRGQFRQPLHRLREEVESETVSPGHLQGLGSVDDVLRRGSPMDVAGGGLTTDLL